MANAAELPVIKLADLADMYKSLLNQLGEKATERIHTTRLKNRILSQNPSVEEQKNGRDVFLAFKSDLANVLDKAHNEDYDEEAMHLAKAASIVHKDMLSKKHTFNGSFESNLPGQFCSSITCVSSQYDTLCSEH